MAVSYYSSDQTLTGSTTVVADCSGGNVAITLPLLSAVTADGMVITVLRDGSSNEVTVVCQGSDVYWDAATTYTLHDDNSAVKICARNAGSVWYGLGTYRTVA